MAISNREVQLAAASVGVVSAGPAQQPLCSILQDTRSLNLKSPIDRKRVFERDSLIGFNLSLQQPTRARKIESQCLLELSASGGLDGQSRPRGALSRRHDQAKSGTCHTMPENSESENACGDMDEMPAD